MPRAKLNTAAVVPFPLPATKRPGPKKGTGKPINLRSATARRTIEYGQRPTLVLGKGIALIYRPARTGGPGSWAVRALRPDSTHAETVIGTADDHTPANGTTVLSCEQAIARAVQQGTLIREGGDQQQVNGSLTVEDAIDHYVERLKSRGRRASAEARAALRKHLNGLMPRTVRSLTANDLTALCDTVPERVRNSFKAALNALPPGIRPSLEVTRCLNGQRAHVPEGDEARTIGVDEVPDQKQVRAIVRKARNHDDAFGRFVATLAVTGCRPSQVAGCRVRDLEGDMLLVPPSRKGRPGKAKPWARRPLPAALATELRGASEGRDANALLFPLPLYERDHTPRDQGGTGWRLVGEQPWHRTYWGREAREAGIEDGLYQLRHASVVRMLLNHVPPRVIAAALDTSVVVLESAYSRWIGVHGEDLMRADVERLSL